MVFSSYTFILLFLPVVLVGYTVARRISMSAALNMLLLASLFYYGYWKPEYLLLLSASAFLNFRFGLSIGKSKNARILLAIGVAFNLGLLAYFKYAAFLVETSNIWLDSSFYVPQIVLPLGISFFTFQQIAYLVDVFQGKTCETNFRRFFIFVAFFPQLIAGPIVHHSLVLPQLRNLKNQKIAERLVPGLSFFSIGLLKKVGIADQLAKYADQAFEFAAMGRELSLVEAWSGTLAYTMQIYFDFSGYSDMAIGLGLLFGISLPYNFASPYKAKNIIEFWRRWHITLSNFLKDYLYIPLGGNRRGKLRRYQNLMITMLLGGLWHGAAWQYVIWGGLHGAYLVINHGFKYLYQEQKYILAIPQSVKVILSTGTTFVFVAIAWVYFRAENMVIAQGILNSMFSVDKLTIPRRFGSEFANTDFFNWTFQAIGFFPHFGPDYKNVIYWLAICFAVVWLCPNSQKIIERLKTNVFDADTKSHAKLLKLIWTVAVGVGIGLSLVLINQGSVFIYYQF